jgi:hypothetical protein
VGVAVQSGSSFQTDEQGRPGQGQGGQAEEGSEAGTTGVIDFGTLHHQDTVSCIVVCDNLVRVCVFVTSMGGPA